MWPNKLEGQWDLAQKPISSTDARIRLEERLEVSVKEGPKTEPKLGLEPKGLGRGLARVRPVGWKGGGARALRLRAARG